MLTTCRLRADAGELRRRLTARRADAGYIDRALAEAAVLDAGDLCVDTSEGRSAAYLAAAADRAVADAAALERAAVGDVRLDTDRLTAAEVADAIIAETHWPR